MKKDQDDVLVSIQVNDLAWMTPRGRHRIALWMMRQARLIQSKSYHSLAKRYRAKYMWPSMMKRER